MVICPICVCQALLLSSPPAAAVFLQTTLFWLLSCLVSLDRKIAPLFLYSFPLSSKAHVAKGPILGLHSGLLWTSAQSRMSTMTSYVLLFQMTVIQCLQETFFWELDQKVNWGMKMFKGTLTIKCIQFEYTISYLNIHLTFHTNTVDVVWCGSGIISLLLKQSIKCSKGSWASEF